MRARVTVLALAIVATGCPDPVHDDLVAEQGPEAANVAAGPLHRAGQRCGACHGHDGPSSVELSVAGTVFVHERETAGASNVEVVIRDARGVQRSFTPNTAGNFYATRAAWDPTFPLRTELRLGARVLAMRTEIPREGSCGACHAGEGGPQTMPRVSVEAAR